MFGLIMNCLRKQQDNNSESTNKLIEKLKSNEYIMYGGNEVDEMNKLYNLIRHYKQVLEAIEDMIVLALWIGEV